MKNKNIFLLISFTIIIISICFVTLCDFSNNQSEYIYYNPKLHPILNENHRPSYAGAVDNPRIKLLNETDKGIVFELVDTASYTDPSSKDNFYCMLTEDKTLRYFNGYIRYNITDMDVLNNLNIDKSELKDISKLMGISFEFQVLDHEYVVNLTDEQ